MNTKKMNSEALTLRQMVGFQEEIAETAGVLNLGAELPRPAAVNGAMGMLSQRIGFLVEEAGRQLGGPCAQLRGCADQWLLPQVAQKGGAQ